MMRCALIFCSVLFLILLHIQSCHIGNGLYNTRNKDCDTVELKIKQIELKTINIKSGFYVIENDSEYSAMQNNTEDVLDRFLQHPTVKYPKINFNKYVLMGYSIDEAGCDGLSSRRLIYLKKEKQIWLIVYEGYCIKSWVKKYWILVKRSNTNKITYNILYNKCEKQPLRLN